VVYTTVEVLNTFGVISRQQSIAFLGLSYPGLVDHTWLHQLITAPLMHGSLLHLLFNILSLWMLGPQVERLLGLRRYVTFSVLCAFSSMLGFMLLNIKTGRIVIGYSGVIFGLLVAQAVYFPNSLINVFAFFTMRMKQAAVLMGAIELYLTITGEGGGTANAAHLFGGLAAFVYLRALRPRRKSSTGSVLDYGDGPIAGTQSRRRRNRPRLPWDL